MKHYVLYFRDPTDDKIKVYGRSGNRIFAHNAMRTNYWYEFPVWLEEEDGPLSP